MTITLTFKKFTTKPQTVTIELNEQLTMEQLRKLWEFEQFINGLPGVMSRLHVGVE